MLTGEVIFSLDGSGHGAPTQYSVFQLLDYQKRWVTASEGELLLSK